MENSEIKTINIDDDIANVNNTEVNLVKNNSNNNNNLNNQVNNNSNNNQVNNNSNNNQMNNNQINNNSNNEVNNNSNNNQMNNDSNNEVNNNSGNEEVEIVSSDDETYTDSESDSESDDEEDEIDVNDNNLFFMQDTIRDGDLYKKYEDAISVFFRKERESDDFIRITKDDMYIMIDKKNDKNKTVIIPPKVVNINKYYMDKEKKKSEIYNTISNIISDIKNEVENKSKFNELKEELTEINKETNLIKKVLNDQKSVINYLTKKQTDALFKLSELFFKRNQIYRKLEHKKINNEQIKELLKIYKENGNQIPKDEFLKTLVDKLKLDFFNIKNILIWINISRTYISLQGEVNKTKKELEMRRRDYQKINNNFIIKMPEVDDNKDVEVTINVPSTQKGGDMEVQEPEVKVIKIDDAQIGKIVGDQLRQMADNL